MAEESAAVAKPNASRPRMRGLGLSGKLLLLTVLFVMMAEVLIYVPSVANFRLNWLHDRLSAAYTAALVFEAAPNGMVPDSLAKAILDSIGARAVAVKMGQQPKKWIKQVTTGQHDERDSARGQHNGLHGVTRVGTGALGALREQGQQGDERHYCHVLKEQNGEGTLPIIMLQLSPFIEDLQGDGGR